MALPYFPRSNKLSKSMQLLRQFALTKRRARDSNPQPVSRHLISSQAEMRARHVAMQFRHVDFSPAVNGERKLLPAIK